VLTLPLFLVIFDVVRENMPVRGLNVDRHVGNARDCGIVF
jgi:hypothetical protein